MPLVRGGGVGATLETTSGTRVLGKLLVGVLPEGLLKANLGLGKGGGTIIEIGDQTGPWAGTPLKAILVGMLHMGGAGEVARGGLQAEMGLEAEATDREGEGVAVMEVEEIMAIGIVEGIEEVSPTGGGIWTSTLIRHSWRGIGIDLATRNRD